MTEPITGPPGRDSYGGASMPRVVSLVAHWTEADGSTSTAVVEPTGQLGSARCKGSALPSDALLRCPADSTQGVRPCMYAARGPQDTSTEQAPDGCRASIWRTPCMPLHSDAGHLAGPECRRTTQRSLSTSITGSPLEISALHQPCPGRRSPPSSNPSKLMLSPRAAPVEIRTTGREMSEKRTSWRSHHTAARHGSRA